MKKLMYFVGVCALCTTMTTACTNNETKSEQEAINIVNEENINSEIEQKDVDKKNVDTDIEQEESNVAIQIKDDYFIVNKEKFRTMFNSVADKVEDLESLSEWEYELNKFESYSAEFYTAHSSKTTILLSKFLNDENFLNISLDSIIESEEDLMSAQVIAYLVATICESNTAEYEPENFSENIDTAFLNAIDIGEKQNIKDKLDTMQLIKGEKLTYSCMYDAENKVSTFMISVLK